MRGLIALTVLISLLSVNAGAQVRLRNASAAPLLQAPAAISEKGHSFYNPQQIAALRPPLEESYVSAPLAKDAATWHLPFFCRQELNAEKRLGVPLRLRLGSVQYTDWLEQKPNAVDPR